ncbi:Fic family protein [Kineosporia mesophila]|uniref:Fic family protein n=1 Tax=Kineosporia mesophila TaxID=566012 RepID=A0ABP6ZXI2_9ACTN|nr:Fic family protein [Kineosporia mesophila]
MDRSAFTATSPGDLVPITGTDPHTGPWSHVAFVPHPLPFESPDLSGLTYRAVANARAALAALDSTARQLPNPRLFRRPALQAEAQSTSALEGTYAPLADVLTADQDRPPSSDLREVLNYVSMGNTAFAWLEEGRQLGVGMLENLQSLLVAGTSGETASSGAIRDHQVVVGSRLDAGPRDLPIRAARFVPAPPGLDLRASLQDLLDWMTSPVVPNQIDPVVAAAMAHYQFETLHPFHDGNGRIGRLLIVAHLLAQGVLLEPTLTVSPWFETRRTEYYDRLLAVSRSGDWDHYVQFFATGLEASAKGTHRQMSDLVAVQDSMREVVRASPLRADSAHLLIDYTLANTSFTIRAVERDLELSYARANQLVGQLVDLGILTPLATPPGTTRRFAAPAVLDVLVRDQRLGP